MSDAWQKERIFYGRIAISVILYLSFAFLSVVAVLAGTLDEQPLLLGGLLIGSVLLLPRTPRRPTDDESQDDEQAARRATVQKWLVWVRAGYLVVALFLWFGLPEIV